MTTKVFEGSAQWERIAYLKLENNFVIFDDSWGEYGPIQFDLELLEQKIKEHKEKLNESRINK
jgi:hypothetical protein